MKTRKYILPTYLGLPVRIFFLLFICLPHFVIGQSSVNSYDKNGRLIKQEKAGSIVEYTYDELGNRLTLVSTKTAQNQEVDLWVSSIFDYPENIANSTNFEFKFQVNNRSNSQIENVFNEVFWSSSESITDNSVNLFTGFVPKLISNQSVLHIAQIDLPDNLADGPGYLVISVDSRNLIAETDETNNIVAFPLTIDNSLREESITANFQSSLRYICPGTSIFFNDLSEGNVTEWEWQFSGGSPATSTEQNPTVTYNEAGTYEVTLIAKSGDVTNQKTETAYITVEGTGSNTASSVSIQYDQLAICENGSTILSAPDGFTTYSWSTGETSQSIEVNSPGDYSLQVTKCNGETLDSEVVSVTQEVFEVIIADLLTPTCTTKGRIGLVVSGIENYTITWADGFEGYLRTELDAGYYEATVLSSTGCEKTISVLLEQLDLPKYTLSTTPSSTCGANDGAVTLEYDPTRNYSVIWSSGQVDVTSLDDLAPGTYSVEVTDTDTGCSSESSFVIGGVQGESPDISLELGNTTCGQANGSAEVIYEAGKNYSFLWSNQATGSKVETLQSGNYMVTVTDEDSGCSTISDFVIEAEEDTSPRFEVQTTPTTCGRSNGSAMITFEQEGDYQFVWNEDDNLTGETLTGLTSGDHQVTITNTATGCSTTSIFVIEAGEDSSPQFTVDPLATTCGLGNGKASVELDTDGDYLVVWDNDRVGTSIDGLTAGEHMVEVLNKNTGCSTVKTFMVDGSIDVLSTITFSIDQTTCGQSNGSISLGLDEEKTYSILWGDQSTESERTELAPGIYTVTIKDEGSTCEGTKNFTINGSEDTSPVFTSNFVHTSCAEENGALSIAISSIGEYQIKLNGAIISSSISNLTEGQVIELGVAGLAAGEHRLDIINKLTDCSSEMIFTINNSNPETDFQLGDDLVAHYKDEKLELPTPTGISGQWTVEGVVGKIEYRSSENKWYFLSESSGLGTYSVTFTSACGNSKSINITVAIVSGIEDEVLVKTGIRIFPNPSDEFLTIQKESAGTEYARDIRLMNTQGKELVMKKYDQPTFRDRWDISQFPSGLYFIEINTDKGSYRVKVIIRH